MQQLLALHRLTGDRFFYRFAKRWSRRLYRSKVRAFVHLTRAHLTVRVLHGPVNVGNQPYVYLALSANSGHRAHLSSTTTHGSTTRPTAY